VDLNFSYISAMRLILVQRCEIWNWNG